MKNISKGFSLIEVLFAIFIVSIALAGLMSMSVSFENSKDKHLAAGLSEMITYSIFSAMRLNPEGFRDIGNVGGQIELSEFNNSNSSDYDLENSTNPDDFNSSELLTAQKYYLREELFQPYNCDQFSNSVSVNDGNPFCLNLEQSIITPIGDCKPIGLNISKPPTKIRIDLVIERKGIDGNNPALNQSTIVCI